MEDPLARGTYQIFLYVMLYIGIAALGGFVGYIASFLYHGSEEEPEEGDEEGPEGNYKSPR